VRASTRITSSGATFTVKGAAGIRDFADSPAVASSAMRIQASRELLAARPEVWAFVAEPYHLADWYPGVSGVTPDRRGSAAGARWQIVASNEPTLLRKPRSEGTLVVTASEPPRLFAFQLVREKLSVRVELEAVAEVRTLATVAIEGPWLIAYRRTLARRAVARLHALYQTAATL
jgi:hypothetical protein